MTCHESKEEDEEEALDIWGLEFGGESRSRAHSFRLLLLFDSIWFEDTQLVSGLP